MKLDTEQETRTYLEKIGKKVVVPSFGRLRFEHGGLMFDYIPYSGKWRYVRARVWNYSRNFMEKIDQFVEWFHNEKPLIKTPEQIEAKLLQPNDELYRRFKEQMIADLAGEERTRKEKDK